MQLHQWKKIWLFGKIAVTFELIMQFWCPFGIKNVINPWNLVYFITRSQPISNPIGVTLLGSLGVKGSVTEWIRDNGVCRAAPGFAWVC